VGDGKHVQVAYDEDVAQAAKKGGKEDTTKTDVSW